MFRLLAVGSIELGLLVVGTKVVGPGRLIHGRTQSFDQIID